MSSEEASTQKLKLTEEELDELIIVIPTTTSKTIKNKTTDYESGPSFDDTIITVSTDIPEGISEDDLDHPAEYELKNGKGYLIIERKTEQAFVMYVDGVMHGKIGLMISRQYPEELKIQLGLDKTPILWLSKDETYKDSISPGDIGRFVHVIKEYMKANNNAFILIDGFEYLVTNNGFEKVNKALDDILDSVAQTGSILLLPVSPEAIGKDKLAIMARLMIEIEGKY